MDIINKIDVSLLVPTIRIPNLPNFYKSLQKSCSKYSFEIVFISPFELPDTLKEYNNIKWIQDYGTPSRCSQLGLFECEGELLYHTVDDAIFFEGKVDEGIDLYKKVCGRKDVVNMRYREGPNFSGAEMHPMFWTAWYHQELRLPGIPQHYKISLHHLLNREYLMEMGAYDCSFIHMNFNLHDTMFRIQYDGGRLFDSPSSVTNCDQFSVDTVDHKPIFDSHNQEDLPRFRTLYSDPHILQKRSKIDINNWSDSPTIWKRRFKEKLPVSYNEIVETNDA